MSRTSRTVDNLTRLNRLANLISGRSFSNNYGKHVVFYLFGNQYTNNLKRKRAYRMDDASWVPIKKSFLSKVISAFSKDFVKLYPRKT